MIKLTRVDDRVIVVNEDFIENISQAPDTIITMQSGRSYVVKETLDEVIEKSKDYKIKCRGRNK